MTDDAGKVTGANPAQVIFLFACPGFCRPESLRGGKELRWELALLGSA